MKFKHYRRLLRAAIIAAVSLVTTAHAASFTVLPVRVYLVPEKAISSVKVTNRSDEPVMIQSKTVRWEQPDGTQVLSPTTDIIVSPPIFELAPKSTQVVRIAVNNSVASGKEKTYRLFLTEVPMDDTDAANKTGIDVALRLSLPIFVTPKSSTPNLSALIEPSCTNKKTSSLRISNAGTKHVMLLRMQIHSKEGEEIEEVFHPAYLLSDSSRKWDLQAKDEVALNDRKLELKYETVQGQKKSIPIDKIKNC